MKSCLVIDDSGTIRALIQVHLTGLGLEFHEAVDGVKGLEAAKKVHPSVIIADLQMPSLNGLDFAKALRALDDIDLRNTPIVLLTAAKDANVEDDARSAGINHCMHKPIDGPALQRLVKRIVGTR